MFCFKCGTNNNEANQFCVKCGCPFADQAVNNYAGAYEPRQPTPQPNIQLADQAVNNYAGAQEPRQPTPQPNIQQYATNQHTVNQSDAPQPAARPAAPDAQKKPSKRTFILAAVLGVAAAVLAFSILYFTVGFGSGGGKIDNKANGDADRIVTRAVDALKQQWKEIYSDDMYIGCEGYLEIKNARIIYINDEIEAGIAEEMFGNVDYIVEFIIYSDYFASAPYYMNIGLYDTVVFYDDGYTEVTRSMLNIYRARTYEADLSNIIKSIEDLGDKYNAVFKLR